MAMRPLAGNVGFAALCAILGAILLCAAPGAAIAGPEPAASAQDESLAQAVKPRPRTKVRVYRGYPNRRSHAVYPLPYDVEYPGPNGVRHCVNRYVTERRPSGNVIVPQMRCTWVVRR